jgi:hypothetical protein
MTQNICIWAVTVECLTYTIARTAALSGVNVYVVTKPKDQESYYGHSLFYEKLEEIKNVTILNQFEPIELDWLYIELAATGLNSQLINCARHARQIGLLSSCSKPSYVKAIGGQLKEIVKYLPIALKAKRVFLIDGFYKFDLYGLYAKRLLTGYDVHSNFLGSDELHHKMFAFAWRPEALRKYKLNFIGNRNPQHRTELIASVKSHLTSQGLLSNQEDYSDSKLVWIEYGDSAGEKRGVESTEYIHLLSESDFTLSPPGYIKMTHRTIEALVQGSIPVLHENELGLYDIDLRNRVNCLTVKNQDWVAATKTIMTISQEEVIYMRSNILAMRDKFLSDEAFSRRLQTKMGLV